ncbi:MAG: flagellar basal body-associated FliL family protein [Bdellovibrionales bacterium]|nr:flagellar basal body-associated FliL family protein [Bdellovibrionales bacterium]
MKKLMTFAFMGVNLVVLGLGSYLVYMSTLGVVAKSTSNEEATRELASFEESLRGDPVLYTMTPFNTNLEGVPRRLIRLELSLEMMDEEGYEEVIGIAPQARDSIMRILNSKTFSDVETVQGKLHLKNEIVADLNSSLRKGVVKNVYFSELVVQ